MSYTQPSAGGYGLNLAVNSTSWIAFALVICIGIFKWIKAKQVNYSKTSIVLAIVLITLFIPLLWSESPWRETSYGRYFAITAFLALVIASQQFTLDKKNIQYFWAIIIVGILIQCAIGIYQYFMSHHLMELTGYRPIGTFQQVNVYASLIATGLGISVYQIFSQKLSKCLLFIHGLMVFFAGVLEAVVLSRTGILASVLIVSSLFLLFRFPIKQVLIVLSLIAFGIITSIGMNALKPSKSETRFSNQSSTYDGYGGVANFNARVHIYKTTLSLIKEAPILGHGLGSFHYKYLNRQAQTLKDNPELSTPNTNSQLHPHNEILFWWAEGGLIPVLALIFFAIWFGVRVWRHGEITHKAVWLCCIPIVLHSQTEYPLYHSVPHLALLALLISQSIPEAKLTISSNAGLLPKFIITLLPVTVTVFMVTNLHTLWLLNQHTQTKDPKYLFKVLTPFGNQAFLSYKKSELFLKVSNPEVILEAKALMKYEVLVRPQERAYWFLYIIEKASKGREQEAQNLYKQGIYLFPASVVFK
jgi:O-antigen polymerase